MLIVSEGNWLEADELQPEAQLGPVSCCSIKGGSWGTSPSAASLGCRVGMWEDLLCSFGGFWGSLGLPNVHLTFSLIIWSPFVESAAV